MKRVLVTTIISLIILILLPYTTILAELPEFPESEEAYIIEGNSKSTIINQNSDKELNMGDITDVIVSKVTLDTLQGKLSDSIQLTKEDLKSLNTDDSEIFVENQALTYQDLLNILLLTSNDNASKLLGINIGKKLSGNDETDNTEALNLFIEKLNETSKELKLSKTKFTDVTGEKNTTTPTDLTAITQATLGDKTIASIINSSSYELKIKQDNKEQDKQEDQEKNENRDDEKIITIDNRNAYLLSTISSIQVSESEDELEQNSTDEGTKQDENSVKNRTGELENQTDDETNEDVQKVSYLTIDKISTIDKTNSQTPKSTTVGYFSNPNSEEACGIFLTEIDKAQIAGTLSNASDAEIGNQISTVISELKNNYSFVDLSDNEAITSQYSLENVHFTSPKSLSLCGIDTLNAYMPTSDSKPKTEVVWNEDYIKPTGEKYQLIQSIEPLTQIASLEIKNGEQTQSIPLYNTDKVTIRNWTDSLLKYGLISFVIILVLLIIWRLIYVHNRRKVLRRKRLRRLQRQRQLRARQLAVQQDRNQSR